MDLEKIQEKAALGLSREEAIYLADIDKNPEIEYLVIWDPISDNVKDGYRVVAAHRLPEGLNEQDIIYSNWQ